MTGKTAVITGGAHGIGRAVADAFLREGASVYIIDKQPGGRVGKPEDIAETVLFLCSDKAGFITGENICIDGGMTKLMIYHGEHGWTYRE